MKLTLIQKIAWPILAASFGVGALIGTGVRAAQPQSAPPAALMAPKATRVPTMTPMIAVTPTFTGKRPNAKVSPAWWPCEEGMIKANRKSKIYHVPTGQSYVKTFEDVTCYVTVQEAQAAKFRPAKK